MVFDETLSPIAEALLRFSSFAGHAILFGCVPVAIFVLRPAFVGLPSGWKNGRERVARRLDGLVVAMLVASAAAAVVGVLIKAIQIANLKQADLTTDSFRSVLDSSYGQWYAVRIPLLLALAILLVGRVHKAIFASDSGSLRLWWLGWGGLALALLATTTFAGHASVAEPRGPALINDVIHLASGATWFTGIVMLAIVLPDAWISKDPVERLSVLAPVVVRFSRLALVSVTIVAITGTLNSFLHVGKLADMTSTSYGQTLSVKILLFLVILATGAVNHFIIRKRLENALTAREPTSAHRTFRRTIALELAVAVGLMALTGALVGLRRTEAGETAAGKGRPPVTRPQRL